MKIDDFLKEEMNWTDRDLEYRPVIGYWKVTELLQKWGEKQLLLHDVVGQSKQLKAFLTWLEKEGGSPFIDKDALIDDWLKSL
jgi:hypothetical protein